MGKERQMVEIVVELYKDRGFPKAQSSRGNKPTTTNMKVPQNNLYNSIDCALPTNCRT